MGTAGDIKHRKRFTALTSEVEGAKYICRDCGIPLADPDIDCEGIGSVASALPMKFCPQCGAYYILWRNNGQA